MQMIYERFATGESPRDIAAFLNVSGAPSPRAQQGRASGWSYSTITAILERPLYRGDIVHGRTESLYGRELGRRSRREYAQLDTPEDTWIRVHDEAIRIVSEELAARCDKRRRDSKRRYFASLARNDGRVPERTHGHYLGTGGLLVCPTCGGHFEAFKSPWKGTGVYLCATRRRKPGTCNNKVALPIEQTDNILLGMIEGEVLTTQQVEELLALLGDGSLDNYAYWTQRRDALRQDIDKLVQLTLRGASPESVGPQIQEREKEIARLDEQLRMPHPEPVDIDKLRAALLQRTAEWKRDLRGNVKVARLVVRRLLGPITLFTDKPAWVPEADTSWIAWEAEIRREKAVRRADTGYGVPSGRGDDV